MMRFASFCWLAMLSVGGEKKGYFDYKLIFVSLKIKNTHAKLHPLNMMEAELMATRDNEILQ